MLLTIKQWLWPHCKISQKIYTNREYIVEDWNMIIKGFKKKFDDRSKKLWVYDMPLLWKKLEKNEAKWYLLLVDGKFYSIVSNFCNKLNLVYAIHQQNNNNWFVGINPNFLCQFYLLQYVVFNCFNSSCLCEMYSEEIKIHIILFYEFKLGNIINIINITANIVKWRKLY